MKLSDNQIKILQFIYDSNNHYINGNDLSKLIIDFPKLKEELQIFIDADIVEFEKSENKYYLAYEGFELIENKNKATTARKSNIVEYEEVVESLGGVKQVQRMAITGILSLSVIITILYFIAPNILNNHNVKPKDKIDKATLNKIKIQIEESVDSIQNIGN